MHKYIVHNHNNIINLISTSGALNDFGSTPALNMLHAFAPAGSALSPITTPAHVSCWHCSMIVAKKHRGWGNVMSNTFPCTLLRSSGEFFSLQLANSECEYDGNHGISGAVTLKETFPWRYMGEFSRNPEITCVTLVPVIWYRAFRYREDTNTGKLRRRRHTTAVTLLLVLMLRHR